MMHSVSDEVAIDRTTASLRSERVRVALCPGVRAFKIVSAPDMAESGRRRLSD